MPCVRIWLDLLHERKQSLAERLISRWELALLRRKPRSKKDKLIVLIETAVLVAILCIGSAIGLIQIPRHGIASLQTRDYLDSDQTPERKRLHRICATATRSRRRIRQIYGQQIRQTIRNAFKI